MTTQNKLIRMKAVQELTGLSKSTVYRLMADGKFPASVRMTVKTVAFVSNEVEAWVDARIAERVGGA